MTVVSFQQFILTSVIRFFCKKNEHHEFTLTLQIFCSLYSIMNRSRVSQDGCMFEAAHNLTTKGAFLRDQLVANKPSNLTKLSERLHDFSSGVHGCGRLMHFQLAHQSSSLHTGLIIDAGCRDTTSAAPRKKFSRMCCVIKSSG